MQKLDLDTLMNDELGEEEKPFELRYARDTQPVQPEQTAPVGLPIRSPMRQAESQTLEQTIQDVKELPFDIADFASAMLPGAGISEAVGTGVENPVSSALGKEEAMPIPSLKKDVEEGNYLDAGLKGLGVVGDALTLAGTGLALTGIGSGPGAALIATGLAAKGISKYGDDVAKSLAKLGDIDEEAAQVAAKRLDDFADQDKPVGAATSMLKAEIKKARPKPTADIGDNNPPRATAPTRELGLFNRAEEAVANMDIPEEGIRADALMARLRDDPDVPNDEVDLGIGLMTNPDDMITKEMLDDLFARTFGIQETVLKGDQVKYAEYEDYRLPDEPESDYTEIVYQLKSTDRPAYTPGESGFKNEIYDLGEEQDYFSREVKKQSRKDFRLFLESYPYERGPNAPFEQLSMDERIQINTDWFNAFEQDIGESIDFIQKRIAKADSNKDTQLTASETASMNIALNDLGLLKSMVADKANRMADDSFGTEYLNNVIEDFMTSIRNRSGPGYNMMSNEKAFRVAKRVDNWLNDNERTLLVDDDFPETALGKTQWKERAHFGFRSENQLAHMRTSVRTTPDGNKVLVVEEIQSDAFKPGGAATLDAGDVPFKNKAGYTNMMLARAMRMAAEQDLDGVVVLSAAEQIQRNKQGFTNVVDKMTSYTDSLPDGSNLELKRVALTMKDGSIKNLIVNKDGKVVQAAFDEQFEGKQLSDVIGSKKTAQDLLDKDQEIAGADRVIGDSGYKDVYDNRIPARLKQIVKRMDADGEVTKTDLQVKGLNTHEDIGIYAEAADMTDGVKRSIITEKMIDDTPEGFIVQRMLNDGLDEWTSLQYDDFYLGDYDDGTAMFHEVLDEYSTLYNVMDSFRRDYEGAYGRIRALAQQVKTAFPDRISDTVEAQEIVERVLFQKNADARPIFREKFEQMLEAYRNSAGNGRTIKNNNAVLFTPEMKAEILGRGLPRLRTGGLVGKK